jgi:2-polyprenyl-3-methyl-5-hydroxy-6-metoxy-1,4-benzoquinol methylase
MKYQNLEILRCPSTKSKLELISPILDKFGYIKEGLLQNQNKTKQYYIKNYIPRFVSSNNYADNFGMQWNKFSHTQLDSFSGLPISENRFYLATNWNPENLKDKWILDIGCGAGRFAEIALQAGAYVVALDYSSSVDACYNNLSHNKNLLIIQGDIYELPLCPEFFDYVYSLGVLQHTPDVKKAFFSLPPMLKKGGSFCVDFYEKSWRSFFLPKYWLRPFTKRLNQVDLFNFLEKVVPFLFNISEVLRKIPIIGKYLMRFIPVANWSNTLPLNKKQLKEWALLDTFDWLSPAYDNPQTSETLLKWLNKSNLQDIEVLKAGHLVGRGTKK